MGNNNSKKNIRHTEIINIPSQPKENRPPLNKELYVANSSVIEKQKTPSPINKSSSETKTVSPIYLSSQETTSLSPKIKQLFPKESQETKPTNSSPIKKDVLPPSPPQEEDEIINGEPIDFYSLIPNIGITTYQIKENFNSENNIIDLKKIRTDLLDNVLLEINLCMMLNYTHILKYNKIEINNNYEIKLGLYNYSENDLGSSNEIVGIFDNTLEKYMDNLKSHIFIDLLQIAFDVLKVICFLYFENTPSICYGGVNNKNILIKPQENKINAVLFDFSHAGFNNSFYMSEDKQIKKHNFTSELISYHLLFLSLFYNEIEDLQIQSPTKTSDEPLPDLIISDKKYTLKDIRDIDDQRKANLKEFVLNLTMFIEKKIYTINSILDITSYKIPLWIPLLQLKKEHKSNNIIHIYDNKIIYNQHHLHIIDREISKIPHITDLEKKYTMSICIIFLNFFPETEQLLHFIYSAYLFTNNLFKSITYTTPEKESQTTKYINQKLIDIHLTDKILMRYISNIVIGMNGRFIYEKVSKEIHNFIKEKELSEKKQTTSDGLVVNTTTKLGGRKSSKKNKNRNNKTRKK